MLGFWRAWKRRRLARRPFPAEWYEYLEQRVPFYSYLPSDLRPRFHDYLRAFDLESGAELWKGRLPAGGQATPMTYRLGEDRRQHVVIAAGGHGKMGNRLGDALVAFALP